MSLMAAGLTSCLFSTFQIRSVGLEGDIPTSVMAPLLIGGFAIAFALMRVGVEAALDTTPGSPKDVVNAYLSALQAERFDLAFNYLSGVARVETDRPPIGNSAFEELSVTLTSPDAVKRYWGDFCGRAFLEPKFWLTWKLQELTFLEEDLAMVRVRIYVDKERQILGLVSFHYQGKAEGVLPVYRRGTDWMLLHGGLPLEVKARLEGSHTHSQELEGSHTHSQLTSPQIRPRGVWAVAILTGSEALRPKQARDLSTALGVELPHELTQGTECLPTIVFGGDQSHARAIADRLSQASLRHVNFSLETLLRGGLLEVEGVSASDAARFVFECRPLLPSPGPTVKHRLDLSQPWLLVRGGEGEAVVGYLLGLGSGRAYRLRAARLKRAALASQLPATPTRGDVIAELFDMLAACTGITEETLPASRFDLPQGASEAHPLDDPDLAAFDTYARLLRVLWTAERSPNPTSASPQKFRYRCR